MPSAEELLFEAFASDAIRVDLASRTLIIPPTLTHIGVESDKDVFKVPFILPRFYGEIDFADDFKININYTNAGDEDDVYKVLDFEVGEEEITFSWLIGRHAAEHPGNVKFTLCLKKYEDALSGIVDKEFNTIPSFLKVNEGHETTEAVVAQYPDAIAQLCGIINTLSERVVYLEKLVGLGDNYGYSKVRFENGVLIITPGGANDSEEEPSEPEDPDEPSDPETPDTPVNPVTYTLSGKWIFNENIDLAPAEDLSVVDTGMKTGANFSVPFTRFTVMDGRVSYIINGMSTVVCDSDGWYEDGYRYIEFGSDGVEVDEVTYNWFTANATVYEYEPEEVYNLYIHGAVGKKININGVEATWMTINDESAECRNVSKFKFVDESDITYYFVNDEDVMINLDRVDGWYILTCDTGVMVSDIVSEPEVTYTLGGTYIFNDDLDIPDGTIVQEIDAWVDSEDQRPISSIVLHDGKMFYETGESYDIVLNGRELALIWDPDNGWNPAGYKNIEFYVDVEEQAVSKEFYEWFMVNSMVVGSGTKPSPNPTT